MAMTRQILWGVLLLLGLAPAGAAGQVAVGFRGGIRSSGLDTGQDLERFSDLVLGGYMGFGLSDRLAFQVEVVYGNRGANGLGLGANALDDTATPVDLSMHYLEIPVLLRAGFPGERLLPTFFAGPYAGFLLSCDITPEGGSATSCDEEGVAQRFAPRSTEFGVVVGAGLDVAIGHSTLFVDARYTLGILSIQQGSDPFDARHNGMAFSGGLAVPLGR